MQWPWMVLLLLHTAGVLAKPEPQAQAMAGSQFLFSSSSRYGEPYKSNYSRFPSVLDICASVLPNPKTYPNGVIAQARQISITEKQRMIGRLSFRKGDWWQAAGASPLMPFIPLFFQTDPLNLATFYITDVDMRWGRGYKPGQQVNISGILGLGISSWKTFMDFQYHAGGFRMEPGFSLLSLLMEGIYTELPDGEGRLCLLGCTWLPLRGKNASDPWDQSSTFSPHLSNADCQIVANFRFPAQLSLHNRAVTGTIASLHSPDDGRYFDPVEISSLLDSETKYKFESGDLVKTACSATAEFESGNLSDDLAYRGENFCTSAMEVMSGYTLPWMTSVLLDLKCPLSEAECTGLGPFEVDGGFINGTHLLIHDVQCEEFDEEDSTGPRANVSAVLRAVLPSQLRNPVAEQRTGLDNLTLVMEGEWSKASGKLCMIGCRNDSSSSCDTRITIYIPLRLSLKQRGVLLGTISSLSNGSSSFYPLSFRIPLQNQRIPTELWNSNSPYKFTKRDEPVGFREPMKKSLLKYPSLSSKVTTRDLAEDLSFFSQSIITNPNLENPFTLMESPVNMYVSIVEDNWMQAAASHLSNLVEGKRSDRKDNQFLRVAGLFKFETANQGVVPPYISFEGEYDPAVGRMHLVGCGELQASWKFLHENAHLLEDGLDCRLSMKVQFPPWNTGWFKNPTVKLSLSSTRNRDDPLHFSPVEIQTLPIWYRRQKVDMVWRKKLEEVLSMVTVSLMIPCILSQLFYIGHHMESTLYISQISLAIQALGYTLPILAGPEYLFARFTSDLNDMSATMDYTSMIDGRTQIITGISNVLCLLAFSLTLRMAQKVYKSRIRLLTRRSLEPCRVPRERKVLYICFGIHLLGFTTLILVQYIIWKHNRLPYNIPPLEEDYLGSRRPDKQQSELERQLLQYLGLVEDLFLLPQVVGNCIWNVEGIKHPKALRKHFYMGLTALRLLSHIYSSLRPPVFNHFSSNYHVRPIFNDFDAKLNFFCSKARDIAIPVIAVLLAVAVYIQQEGAERWKGVLGWGKKKVWKWGSNRGRMGSSDTYESLPSQSSEFEMAMESESKF